MTMEKGSMQSNLDCFLNCTTPLVPSQFLAKVCFLFDKILFLDCVYNFVFICYFVFVGVE